MKGGNSPIALALLEDRNLVACIPTQTWQKIVVNVTRSSDRLTDFALFLTLASFPTQHQYVTIVTNKRVSMWVGIGYWFQYLYSVLSHILHFSSIWMSLSTLVMDRESISPTVKHSCVVFEVGRSGHLSKMIWKCRRRYSWRVSFMSGCWIPEGYCVRKKPMSWLNCSSLCLCFALLPHSLS